MLGPDVPPLEAVDDADEDATPRGSPGVPRASPRVGAVKEEKLRKRLSVYKLAQANDQRKIESLELQVADLTAALTDARQAAALDATVEVTKALRELQQEVQEKVAAAGAEEETGTPELRSPADISRRKSAVRSARRISAVPGGSPTARRQSHLPGSPSGSVGSPSELEGTECAQGRRIALGRARTMLILNEVVEARCAALDQRQTQLIVQIAESPKLQEQPASPSGHADVELLRRKVEVLSAKVRDLTLESASLHDRLSSCQHREHQQKQDITHWKSEAEDFERERNSLRALVTGMANTANGIAMALCKLREWRRVIRWQVRYLAHNSPGNAWRRIQRWLMERQMEAQEKLHMWSHDTLGQALEAEVGARLQTADQKQLNATLLKELERARRELAAYRSQPVDHETQDLRKRVRALQQHQELLEERGRELEEEARDAHASELRARIAGCLDGLGIDGPSPPAVASEPPPAGASLLALRAGPHEQSFHRAQSIRAVRLPQVEGITTPPPRRLGSFFGGQQQGEGGVPKRAGSFFGPPQGEGGAPKRAGSFFGPSPQAAADPSPSPSPKRAGSFFGPGPRVTPNPSPRPADEQSEAQSAASAKSRLRRANSLRGDEMRSQRSQQQQPPAPVPPGAEDCGLLGITKGEVDALIEVVYSMKEKMNKLKSKSAESRLQLSRLKAWQKQEVEERAEKERMRKQERERLLKVTQHEDSTATSAAHLAARLRNQLRLQELETEELYAALERERIENKRMGAKFERKLEEIRKDNIRLAQENVQERAKVLQLMDRQVEQQEALQHTSKTQEQAHAQHSRLREVAADLTKRVESLADEVAAAQQREQQERLRADEALERIEILEMQLEEVEGGGGGAQLGGEATQAAWQEIERERLKEKVLRLGAELRRKEQALEAANRRTAEAKDRNETLVQSMEALRRDARRQSVRQMRQERRSLSEPASPRSQSVATQAGAPQLDESSGTDSEGSPRSAAAKERQDFWNAAQPAFAGTADVTARTKKLENQVLEVTAQLHAVEESKYVVQQRCNRAEQQAQVLEERVAELTWMRLTGERPSGEVAERMKAEREELERLRARCAELEAAASAAPQPAAPARPPSPPPSGLQPVPRTQEMAELIRSLQEGRNQAREEAAQLSEKLAQEAEQRQLLARRLEEAEQAPDEQVGRAREQAEAAQRESEALRKEAGECRERVKDLEHIIWTKQHVSQSFFDARALLAKLHQLEAAAPAPPGVPPAPEAAEGEHGDLGGAELLKRCHAAEAHAAELEARVVELECPAAVLQAEREGKADAQLTRKRKTAELLQAFQRRCHAAETELRARRGSFASAPGLSPRGSVAAMRRQSEVAGGPRRGTLDHDAAAARVRELEAALERAQTDSAGFQQQLEFFREARQSTQRLSMTTSVDNFAQIIVRLEEKAVEAEGRSKAAEEARHKAEAIARDLEEDCAAAWTAAAKGKPVKVKPGKLLSGVALDASTQTPPPPPPPPAKSGSSASMTSRRQSGPPREWSLRRKSVRRQSRRGSAASQNSQLPSPPTGADNALGSPCPEDPVTPLIRPAVGRELNVLMLELPAQEAEPSEQEQEGAEEPPPALAAMLACALPKEQSSDGNTDDSAAPTEPPEVSPQPFRAAPPAPGSPEAEQPAASPEPQLAAPDERQLSASAAEPPAPHTPAAQAPAALAASLSTAASRPSSPAPSPVPPQLLKSRLSIRLPRPDGQQSAGQPNVVSPVTTVTSGSPRASLTLPRAASTRRIIAESPRSPALARAASVRRAIPEHWGPRASPRQQGLASPRAPTLCSLNRAASVVVRRGGGGFGGAGGRSPLGGGPQPGRQSPLRCTSPKARPAGSAYNMHHWRGRQSPERAQSPGPVRAVPSARRLTRDDPVALTGIRVAQAEVEMWRSYAEAVSAKMLVVCQAAEGARTCLTRAREGKWAADTRERAAVLDEQAAARRLASALCQVRALELRLEALTAAGADRALLGDVMAVTSPRPRGPPRAPAATPPPSCSASHSPAAESDVSVAGVVQRRSEGQGEVSARTTARRTSQSRQATGPPRGAPGGAAEAHGRVHQNALSLLALAAAVAVKVQRQTRDIGCVTDIHGVTGRRPAADRPPLLTPPSAPLCPPAEAPAPSEPAGDPASSSAGQVGSPPVLPAAVSRPAGWVCSSCGRRAVPPAPAEPQQPLLTPDPPPQAQQAISPAPTGGICTPPDESAAGSDPGSPVPPRPSASPAPPPAVPVVAPSTAPSINQLEGWDATPRSGTRAGVVVAADTGRVVAVLGAACIAEVLRRAARAAMIAARKNSAAQSQNGNSKTPARQSQPAAPSTAAAAAPPAKRVLAQKTQLPLKRLIPPRRSRVEPDPDGADSAAKRRQPRRESTPVLTTRKRPGQHGAPRPMSVGQCRPGADAALPSLAAVSTPFTVPSRGLVLAHKCPAPLTPTNEAKSGDCDSIAAMCEQAVARLGAAAVIIATDLWVPTCMTSKSPSEAFTVRIACQAVDAAASGLMQVLGALRARINARMVFVSVGLGRIRRVQRQRQCAVDEDPAAPGDARKRERDLLRAIVSQRLQRRTAMQHCRLAEARKRAMHARHALHRTTTLPNPLQLQLKDKAPGVVEGTPRKNSRPPKQTEEVFPLIA
eukprot:TRINITY_DN3543_c0_g1_i2.p1 TRINITY_DN3543_c0_g1~~TRINITY_DN3543_c0_g1_i2.p1  ORF type:complete len:2657 (+),score=894.94 TRINITY_DN3543_c0_g1_i2:74-7972(+)